MKRFLYSVLPVLAALFFSASPIFAIAIPNLTVYVVDESGNHVSEAQVVALNFGSSGPTQNTKIATTKAGVATLALTENERYQVVVSSQGYSPSIVTQLGNGPFSFMASYSAPVVTTITLSNVGVSDVGEVDAAVTNASPSSVLFGQVGLKSGGSPIAFGLTEIDGVGAGTMRIYNVPFAPADTYNVSSFDNQLNKAANASVNSELGSGAPVLSFTLNFNSGVPPINFVGQQSGGGISVDGVVTDMSGVPIVGGNLFINFNGQVPSPYEGGQASNDNRGANVDQNGRFQLFGLNPGTTYYASVFGGCSRAGVCYQGFQDQDTGTHARGSYDAFIPDSSTVQSLSISLQEASGGTGTMAVQIYANVNGVTIPMPHSGISLFPDGAPWSRTSGVCSNGYVQPNPGFANINMQTTTGYALITGLMPGNYMVSANSQFGGYMVNRGTGATNVASNTPPDQTFWQTYGQCGSSGNLRVTISTAYPNGTATGSDDVFVFDSSANLVSQSSTLTITVPLVNLNLAGRVQGTLNFPRVVDLSQDPMTISLNAQCTSGACPPGGFYVLNSASTGPTVNYSIAVSTGYSYYMNISANYWGAVYAGGNQPQPNVTSTSPATVNLTFAPAGRVLGHLYKPDGSVFIVPQNSNGGGGSAPGINAEGNNSWGNNQINSDGSFVIGGLLPGIYKMSAQSWGGVFPYVVPVPQPSVTITANQDSSQDVRLANAVSVKPVVSIAALPSLSIYECGAGMSGNCPPESWGVLALPQGKPLTSATLTPFLGGGGSISGLFQYSPSSGMVNMCYGAYLAQPGFCYGSLAADPVSGTSYDFYLVRKGEFDQLNLAGGAKPSIVFERTLKHQTIKSSLADVPLFSPFGMSTTTLQAVTFPSTPDLSTVQQAVLAGTVTASSMFTQDQFQKLGGDFQNFLKYLPQAWLYDSSGTLKAVGLVTPYPPNVYGVDAMLQGAVSNNDFSTFQALLSTSTGWGSIGFEIRGLTANTTYSMVVTTPNYPPFKESVHTGSAGSTTYWPVNLDSNPGAALSGVVVSTDAVGIANAAVTVQAAGYAATTVVTDSAPVAGHWQIMGLGSGVYTITVSAAGYALGAQTVNVGASNVTAPALALAASNSSITGRVYTTQPICQANNPGCVPWTQTNLSGATVLAYDDTFNINSPASTLPLYHAVTSSSGTYRLDGLQAGDTYQLYVNAHGPSGRGYFVAGLTTVAVAGILPGVDFQLLPKPLTVNVYGHPVSPNYEFLVTNYMEFSGAHAWVGQSPFVKATSTDVSNSFAPSPGGLVLDYPQANLTNGVTYILHIEAQPNNPGLPPVIKELSFGLGLPHNACQNVDETLLGDGSNVNSQGLPLNQSPLDITGSNGSGLVMPAGAVLPILSTAVPTMCMSELSASTSTLSLSSVFTPLGAVSVTNPDAFASNIYQVSLSSINYTAKGIDLTFGYNQSGADLTDLAVFSYSTTTAKWTLVSGVQTIDPVRGTITIKGAQSLASTQGLPHNSSLRAVTTGGHHHANPQALAVARADDSGLFAVMKPSLASTGTATSVSSFKIYNFPNPFNLNNKTVPLRTTAACTPTQASLTTNGTVIKYEVPAGVSGGQATLRIYTTSGRLVAEVDQGNVTPGACYYTTWDGNNRQGSAVANGVYYGILSLPGVSSRDGTFKMAVIK